ncbi:MAG: membrane protein insertion efficiency factor YidD [Candidatus Eisenbacteria bacterium]|uniref:Putative membrane protein insertion efficiency factor n=1 Tax=Eiseniibacteriota bacterium TaxID=2212470 RepID=A0A538TXR1_UNCEI|nr:MAG: membrane protein insertion efficiency factor YidD [Candidatus Eisenbacteria bacterium]
MKLFALGLVRAYQLALGPFARGACRFHPTCSEYALQAIDRHGARRGLVLTLRRLARCHPLGASGYDPVP